MIGKWRIWQALADFSFKRFVGLCVVLLLFLAGFFMLFSSYWLVQHFEIQNFGQILFHLQFPLLDMDSAIVRSFVLLVLLPSLANALLCTALPYFIAFLRINRGALAGFGASFGVLLVLFLIALMQRDGLHGVWLLLSFEKRVLFPSVLFALLAPCLLALYGRASRLRYARHLGFALPLTMIIIAANIANNKLHIAQYFKSQAAPFSNFYEANYIAPESSPNASTSFASAWASSASPKQNLLIILAESLESTFATTDSPMAAQASAKSGGGAILRSLA